MPQSTDPNAPDYVKPADPPAPTEPRFMTAEDFNKAQTAREARFKKEIEGMLAAVVDKLKPAPPKEPDEDDDVNEPAPPVAQQPAAPPGAPAPQVVPSNAAEIRAEKAMRKARAVEEQLKKQQAESAQREAELMARQERTETMAALQAAGVVSQKAALATLKEDKRIVRSEKTGEFVFRMPRKIGGENFDEEMALSDGIKEWLDTDDGKLFAPPKNVEGSGARPGTGNRSTPAGKAEAKMDAAKTLQGFILGGRQ